MRVFLLAVILAAGAGCAGVANRSEFPHALTVGLCEDYPEETRSLPAARADLDQARAAGAQVVRIAFGWDAMESARGEFDWSFWDEFVPLAAEEFGLRLIPYVCYTPRWASTDSGDDHWRAPPRDPADFARFVDVLVRRYGKWIRTWELWNEPDNRAYWTGTRAEFAALVRAGSAAVRTADAQAEVVLGGIAWDLDFLEALFVDERIAPAIDVVNLHSYFETWHADSIEHLPTYVAAASEIVREHGEGERLWMAETGYSSVGARAQVSEVYRARFLHEHTPLAQANALARTLLLAAETRQLELLAWYRINDLPPAEAVIGDDNNRHLGVIDRAGRRKPAFTVLAGLADFFAHAYRVERIPRDDGIEALRFAFADGRRLLAAWLTNAGLPATEQFSVDSRTAVLRTTLTETRRDRVRIADAQGEPVAEKEAAFHERGRDIELELTLRGSEVRLVTIEAQERPIFGPPRRGFGRSSGAATTRRAITRPRRFRRPGSRPRAACESIEPARKRS